MRIVVLSWALIGCTTAVPGGDAAVDPEPEAVRMGPCVPACGPGLICDAAAGVCRLMDDAGLEPDPQPAPIPEGEPAPMVDTSVELLGYRTTADLRDGRYPTHLAHLIGRQLEGYEIALIYDLALANALDRPREVRVTVEVEGFSGPFSQTMLIGSNDEARVDVPAPLDLATIYALDAPADAVLRLTVSEGEAVLVRDARTLTLVPRETLWWVVSADDGSPIDLRPSVATHVTPDDPEVQRLLGAVAAQTTAGRITAYESGDVQQVADQVAAVFKALQARGLRVDALPADYFFEARAVQLPGDVLRSNRGTAMEGVVLFAAVFEAMGLIPIISFGESHALVGVRQAPNSDRAWMVETTRVHVDSAEVAMQAGVDTQNGWVEAGDAAFLPLDVAWLRSQGWAPIPLD